MIQKQNNDKCDIKNCDLNKYKNHNKCILHCEKTKEDNSVQFRDEFQDELREYSNKRLYCESDFMSANGSPVITYKDIVFLNSNLLTSEIFPKNFNAEEILNFKLNSLEFQNCTFNSMHHSSNELHCIYIDCAFNFSWEDFLIKKGVKHSYQGCQFKGKLVAVFDENNNQDSCVLPEFLNCTFDEGFLFENCDLSLISIFNPRSNNKISGQIKFDKAKISKDFKLSNINFNELEIYIKDDFQNNMISFSGCHFEKKLKVRNVETRVYEEDQKTQSTIKSLEVKDCTAGESAYLRIGFLKVEDFVLSNLRLPQNAELNIGDCCFKKFKLTNFRNIGKFKLYKINIFNKKIGERFQIDNTSIGKADFQSIDLTSFEKVVMFDNIFTNIDYSNVQWEKKIEVGQFGKSNKVETAKKRDTYRTLKNIALRNNDQPQALIFYKREMDNHWEITTWKKEFSNKLTLTFNKCTNNFGLNWWLPIFELLVIGLLLYCITLSSLDLNGCELQKYEAITNKIGKYFIFLNPLHKIEFMAKGCWSNLSYFLDAFFRVIGSLLIYQTIYAFRKYSRKL